MSVIWSESGKPITEAVLHDFELRYSCKLPTAYREFMLAQNGGKPDPCDFLLNRSDGKCVFLWLSWLSQFGFSPLDPRDMDWRPDYFEWDLPEDSLPIGYGVSNDVILLYHKGTRTGQVWYKCFMLCAEDGNPNEELHFLAESFTKFLTMLRKNPDRKN